MRGTHRHNNSLALARIRTIDNTLGESGQLTIIDLAAAIFIVNEENKICHREPSALTKIVQFAAALINDTNSCELLEKSRSGCH